MYNIKHDANDLFHQTNVSDVSCSTAPYTWIWHHVWCVLGVANVISTSNHQPINQQLPIYLHRCGTALHNLSAIMEELVTSWVFWGVLYWMQQASQKDLTVPICSLWKHMVFQPCYPQCTGMKWIYVGKIRIRNAVHRIISKSFWTEYRYKEICQLFSRRGGAALLACSGNLHAEPSSPGGQKKWKKMKCNFFGTSPHYFK